MIERGEYIMNKILNPNYGITDATNIDMFKGEDMVEIVTDGYGKIYAYPEDIRKIAPFVNKVKNGMKSISLGKFDDNGEFVPIMCHLSPYYDQYGKRLGEDMVLYGHPEDNGPVAIKELPKEAQDEIHHIRHAKDNNVHFFSFDEEKNESHMTPIVSLNSVPVMDNKVNDTCCDRDCCSNDESSPRIECIPLNEALVIIKAK